VAGVVRMSLELCMLRPDIRNSVLKNQGCSALIQSSDAPTKRALDSCSTLSASAFSCSVVHCRYDVFFVSVCVGGCVGMGLECCW